MLEETFALYGVPHYSQLSSAQDGAPERSWGLKGLLKVNGVRMGLTTILHVRCN
jgi:hypothetical protein